MKKTPRLCAIEILGEWQKTGTSIEILIGNITPFADSRDSGLLKAIIFGVFRNYSTLDWVVGKFSKQPLKKLKPDVLQALRVGVYQLLFMDRVPPAAAVNETVKALKSFRQPRYITGFVNGVLRNVERNKDNLLADIDAENIPEHARFNHPDWLLSRWRKRYGLSKLEEICRSNNSPAALCLRVNTLKISVEDFLALLSRESMLYRQGEYVHEAIWLHGEVGLVESLPGYDDGFFSVQDEMAQLLCCLLAPFEDGSYLDGCAGLGGKTVVMAQLAPAGSRIIAVEPSGKRQQLFDDNSHRLGLPGVEMYQGNLQDFARQASEKFGAVLVDAPCSGIGVIGRHPEIRWLRKPEDLKRYQQKQLELLRTAAGLVQSGGVLVYATCSTEPEENDEVVEKFLQDTSGFVLESGGKFLSEDAQELVDDKGFLRTIPGVRTADGFFAARFRRQ